MSPAEIVRGDLGSCCLSMGRRDELPIGPFKLPIHSIPVHGLPLLHYVQAGGCGAAYRVTKKKRLAGR